MSDRETRRLVCSYCADSERVEGRLREMAEDDEGSENAEVLREAADMIESARDSHQERSVR